jgi:hypothetical protein
MATAAKRDCGPSGETESLAFLVYDLKIAFDANRAIAEDGHFCACHEILHEFFNDSNHSAFTRYPSQAGITRTPVENQT